MRQYILTNSGIFIGYFLLSSLFLTNTQGGADIVFMASVYLCTILHIIGTLIVLAVKRNRAAVAGVGTVLGLFLIFSLFGSYYLRLIWWLVS